jgi:hypothetical protein
MKTKFNLFNGRYLVSILFFLLLPGRSLFSQTEFSFWIEPYTIPNLPGLQSYVAGQYEGKWILIGGRLDGLHLRQPNQSFSASGNNTNVYVVNPETKQVWSASVLSLAAALREQLQSTNMEFLSKGDKLYVVGGYGYSASANNHITYPSLVVVEMPGLINAVLNGQSIQPFFRQVQDDYFAVTGGQLGMLGDTLLLVGGHRFDGRYTPNNSMMFTQAYTHQIRKFKVTLSEGQLSVPFKETVTDAAELHRRDYNLAPQVFTDGSLGYTAFSGVFQVNANLPFLNTVDIKSNHYAPKAGFDQLLNHYHSGNFTLYDAEANHMYSIFFGGMAQYYMDGSGNYVKDDEVPFVSTIGKVTRRANGNMQEEKIGDLPGLLGAGSAFLINHDLPAYANEVIKLEALENDTSFAGYLYGGIESTAPNIFFINDGTQSAAVNRLYKVHIVKKGDVLPVKLLYFRGQKLPQGHLLQWNTTETEKFSHFLIEQSNDGRSFQLLAKIGKNDAGANSYEYLNNIKGDGAFYYRLKMVNLDGSSSLSNIIVLRTPSAAKGLLIFPNPVKDMVIAELPVTEFKQASLWLIDQHGKVLATREYRGGSRQIYLNTSGLPSGVYYMQIMIDKDLLSASFIKQ